MRFPDKVTFAKAPSYYDVDESEIWANGFNAALEKVQEMNPATPVEPLRTQPLDPRGTPAQRRRAREMRA